jgi:hypothetical protein
VNSGNPPDTGPYTVSRPAPTTSLMAHVPTSGQWRWVAGVVILVIMAARRGLAGLRDKPAELHPPEVFGVPRFMGG